MRDKLQHSMVNTVGFEKGRSAQDVIALLREAVRKRSDDGKPLVVFAGDILTAFDEIRHEHLDGALRASGVDIETRIELMKQLFNKNASLLLPGAGETEKFEYSKGGWQGGINTPDEFNCMIQHYLSDVVGPWNDLGLGMSVDDESSACNHIFVADNGFFLADSVDDAIFMFQEVTSRLYQIGFKWKPSSLQFMLIGSLKGQIATMQVQSPDGEHLVLEQVAEMEVLGAMLCDDGEQKPAIDHRLSKAEKVFRKYQAVLCGKGSHAEKLKAWDVTAIASAAYCSGTLSLTKELATHVHSWEHRMLRQVFRLKPASDEVLDSAGWDRYYDRSRRIIDAAKMKHCHAFLVHRLLREYCKEAWHEKTRRDKDGGNRTEKLRLYRTRSWWESAIRTPIRYRRPSGWVHSRRGATLRQWEDLMVAFRGLDWRKWRDNCADERAWKVSTRVLINEICAAWQLPLLPEPVSEEFRQPPVKDSPHFPMNEIEHEKDNEWAEHGDRFVFIIDSQAVQRVVCGHAAPNSDRFMCPLQRVMRRLVAFIDRGMLPPLDVGDPVQWRPRQYNAKADWLCNQALDTR